MKLKVGLKGRYELKVLDAATREVKQEAAFDNLITNNGLNWLGAWCAGTGLPGDGACPLSWCSVGTGTTTPAFTDTALVGYLATTSNRITGANSNDGAPGHTITSTWAYEFAQGSVVGNVAEIGIGPATGGVSLFSRARVLDGGGVPTTIALTSDDILQITYLLTYVPDLTDFISGSFTIGANTYNYTGRVANISYGSFFSAMLSSGFRPQFFNSVTAYESGTLAAVTSQIGGPSSLGTNSLQVYNNLSLTSTWRTSWGVSEANFPSGINGFMLPIAGGQLQFQMVLDAPIMKLNTQQLYLDFSFSWDRV